jgi:hypothetical protein
MAKKKSNRSTDSESLQSVTDKKLPEGADLNVKQVKTKYINIDTRFSNEFLCFPFSEYYIEIQDTIHHVKSLSISCIEIPISFFNICTALENNCFKVVNIDNNNPIIIKIPDEHYSIETLIEKINEELKNNNVDDLKFTLSKKNTTTISSKSNRYILDFSKNEKGNEGSVDKTRLGTVIGFTNPKYYIEPNKSNETENTCMYFNPRYLYLEIKERERKEENRTNYAFESNILCSRISKYIIARITMDYHTFPYGSVMPANLFNGFLISDIRHYKEKIRLEDLEIRLLNEFGFPICLNGFEISFCMAIECEYDD